MGSCLSKKEPSANTTKKKRSLKQDPSANRGPNGPPPSLSPPLPEEEAVVKEVLTETPMPSSATTRSNSRRAPEDLRTKSPVMGEVPPPPAAAAVGDDDRSEEASEAYTASECFSASTARTEKRSYGAEEAEAGEEETSAPKWWPPEWSSPAGKACHRQWRHSATGESPAKIRNARGGARGGGRSSPSPARRVDGRAFPGREPANGNAAAGMRRAHSDRSGRRSVSPAAKLPAAGGGGGGVSRSSSMRKAGAVSPQRATPSPGAAAGPMFRPRAAAGTGREGGERAVVPSAGQEESVENPLVSLECFIFL